MKLMLAADMSFNYIEAIPEKEKIHAFMHEPAKLFQTADFSIVNLENVFGERSEHTPIVKDGPNLISSTDYAEYIRALSPTVVGIANNHTMDYGVAPMRQTKALLEDEGYLCIGAGENLQAQSWLEKMAELPRFSWERTALSMTASSNSTCSTTPPMV